jgi:hypothetical protein
MLLKGDEGNGNEKFPIAHDPMRPTAWGVTRRTGMMRRATR